jgi:transcriptional regulator with XRE-family HTH domain
MNSSVGDAVKWRTFGNRLRMVREDLYGKQGSRSLANALKIPHQTWSNYESGIAVPGDIVLQLQVLYSVNARWLLTGEGDKFDRSRRQSEASCSLN